MSEINDDHCSQCHPELHRAQCSHRGCVAESEDRANQYRAKLRFLLHEKLNEPPKVGCVYCGAEPGEWCDFDCGTPFRILHPDYVSRIELPPVELPSADESSY